MLRYLFVQNRVCEPAQIAGFEVVKNRTSATFEKFSAHSPSADFRRRRLSAASRFLAPALAHASEQYLCADERGSKTCPQIGHVIRRKVATGLRAPMALETVSASSGLPPRPTDSQCGALSKGRVAPWPEPISCTRGRFSQSLNPALLQATTET